MDEWIEVQASPDQEEPDHEPVITTTSEESSLPAASPPSSAATATSPSLSPSPSVSPSPSLQPQSAAAPGAEKMADPASPPQNAMLHVVDDSLTLTSQLQEYMINKWHLGDKGLDYNLVAVFGSQSSGKSTLLNMLFQTNFDVMQGARRQQTTKGLWLSVGTPSNTLVMDVEGTDGRERGENQEMERKSAVFSLAISQVLIINMFESDVGRYNGANYGLLKTVFDVNLQLFQAHGSPKTLLLFIIRDHANSPLENLAEILKTDMSKIWAELSKPKGFEDSMIDDFFDLKFTSLPHKQYCTDQFVERVTALRDWFTNKENPDFLFKPQYHKMIPADGFYKFVSDIWDKIMHNRDLDLPTQRQLLAQFRCNEIATAAHEKVAAAIATQATDIENGQIIPGLGKTLLQLRLTALEEYQTMAHRYDPSVFEKMATVLKEKIHSSYYPLFTGTIRNLFKKAVKNFSEGLTKSLKASKEPFAQIVSGLEEEALSGFISAADEITIPETGWTYQSTLQELKEALAAEVVKKKEDEMKKALDGFRKSLQFSLMEPVTQSLGDAKETMWADVQAVIVRSVDSADKFVSKFQADFACPEAELEEQRAKVHEMILEMLHQKVTDEVSDQTIYAKLKKKFEMSFKYDEAHRPRIWKTVEEIAPIFDEAKRKAEKFLELFSKPDENLDLSVLVADASWGVLIPEAKKSSLWDRLELEAGVMFQEAAHSTTNTFAQIPPWFYVVLLLLGWNELWAILTNPLYLFVTMIMGGALFAMFSLHLEGPVLHVINTVGGELLKMIQNRIMEATNPQPNPLDRRESQFVRRESQMSQLGRRESEGHDRRDSKVKTM